MEEENNKELEKNLKREASDRQKILQQVSENMDSYSFKILAYENKIKEYELMEIKYNNLENELAEKSQMYQTVIDELKKESENKEKEIMKLKKSTLGVDSKSTALKSIVELMIKEYGIDSISEVSGLSESKIKEYLQD